MTDHLILPSKQQISNFHAFLGFYQGKRYTHLADHMVLYEVQLAAVYHILKVDGAEHFKRLWDGLTESDHG